MAGNSTIIHDPVSKDEIEITEQDRHQFQEILNAAIQIEENHNGAIEEINKEHRKFLRRNEQHYNRYKELEAAIKVKSQLKDLIVLITYNTIQKGLLQYQEKINTAEAAKDLEV